MDEKQNAFQIDREDNVATALTPLVPGPVELRGDAQDAYTLAVWTDGQYAYSLRLSQGQNAEVWQQIITGVP